MTSLDQLNPGQRARIEGIAGNDAIVQRLFEMGLVEDEEVELLRVAPLGDPMEIRLRGYNLSLRKGEAARVTVTILPKS